jgi:naphthoate synthase/2-ketocyclohexanecarboxyl-CoA hydrolase
MKQAHQDERDDAPHRRRDVRASTTPTTTPVGVVAFAGAGKHFGAGGDVEWETWGLREAFYNRYPHNRLIRLSRKPVIAPPCRATASAATTTWPTCCDFTIAAEKQPSSARPARGVVEPRRRVLRAVPHQAWSAHKQRREIWMLCRRYPAPEAYEMGLVNKVVPLRRSRTRSTRWVRRALLLASPGCIEVLKAAFDQEMDGYADLGVISSRLYPDWFDTPEGKEGGAAFLAKRKPEFWKLREQERQARDRLADEYEKDKS